MEHFVTKVMSKTDKVWIESTLVLLITIRKVCMNFGGKGEFEFHFYFPEIQKQRAEGNGEFHCHPQISEPSPVWREVSIL